MINTADGYLEKLNKAFEDRFDEAKLVIMDWNNKSVK